MPLKLLPLHHSPRGQKEQKSLILPQLCGNAARLQLWPSDQARAHCPPPPFPLPFLGFEDFNKCGGSGAEVFLQLCWRLGHPCGGLWEVRGWQGCAGFVGWMRGNWRAPRGHLCCFKKRLVGFIQVHDNIRKKSYFYVQVLP